MFYPDRPSRIFLDDRSQLVGASAQSKNVPLPISTHLQRNAFSKATQDDTEVPVPLENALGNIRVIEAVVRSGETGGWEKP